MNGDEPFYKTSRFLLLVLVVLGSIAAVMLSYSDGELRIQSNLKYGLDLEGGSWLQLQLQGAVAQVDADEGKIVQAEFGRLLDGSAITIDEIAANSVTFTTPKEINKNTIDSFGYGISTISKGTDGGTRVILETNKDFLIKKYLENNLNAEVIPIEGRFITMEIRKAVTEDELNTILEPVGGKVIPPFRAGVTEETRDLTKQILEDKLNSLGLKEIPIRTVGDNYILIDLAGVDMATAREIAAKPGKFEIRIQVQGNETAHVLYGNEIIGVDPIQKERDAWGVPFKLSDKGAAALRDAAIQYGAVTDPDAHNLGMYLDDRLVFDAPLAPDLARNIQRVPVRELFATTGTGEEGQIRARELQIHLRAGALPVNVEVIGSGQVSADLGEKFKEQVAIAGIIALMTVAIAVYFRYRQPNIIVPMLATSFSEVIIILGFTAVIGYQLDLATIAGIIVVIGTGVDHLIIITDEVLAGGAMPPSKVYKSRLTKAFAIIFAAAATILIAMSPLLFMGFGAIKGFAVITIVGVLIGVGIARPAYAIIIKDLLMEDTDKKYVGED
ncbi:preprotein translocase subunit SecD [Candidatus Methanoperedens nitroreducens]|uniref:Protein-export membrane protein SecD n=1 Tax=Candidatus Methanoperedens nitratireducens TaxID=1392998 RepID=A0A062V5I6_9EURY|nr:preprotein translocase subunit SecD [Candidatus Methanoperedens nitroreducens]KCZ70670.1 preprotein translocase subunit SecD [Candidatus Methanoperedens nitroreducens]MDJ1420523.1 preprotein translocase subunit SecD [Candidatus Methanoperedens sp.]